MNNRLRVGVFLGLAGATLVACFAFSRAQTNPVAGVIGWLPNEWPGYEVHRGEMGEQEKRWLPDDTTYIKRVYYKPYGSQENVRMSAISATLIVAGSDSRSLHRPEVCLTGQRWTIVKRERVLLETDGGPLEVMDFHLEQALTNTETNQPVLNSDGTPRIVKAHYVYWWVGPGASTASDEERVWLEVWNSILNGRKERWAYPSVQMTVDEFYGRQKTRETIFEFIKKAAPGFQKSLGAEERGDAVSLKISNEEA